MATDWFAPSDTSSTAARIIRECLGESGNAAIAFPSVVNSKSDPVADLNAVVDRLSWSAEMLSKHCSAVRRASTLGGDGNGKLIICKNFLITSPAKHGLQSVVTWGYLRPSHGCYVVLYAHLRQPHCMH